MNRDQLDELRVKPSSASLASKIVIGRLGGCGEVGSGFGGEGRLGETGWEGFLGFEILGM